MLDLGFMFSNIVLINKKKKNLKLNNEIIIKKSSQT